MTTNEIRFTVPLNIQNSGFRDYEFIIDEDGSLRVVTNSLGETTPFTATQNFGINYDYIRVSAAAATRRHAPLSDEELDARDARIEANERRIAATMYDND